MKNIIIKLTAACVLLASFVSCSEDEINYSGVDNFITKLAVTADGITYNAAITDDEILLTVAENTTFAGATVKYTISENATISPLPEDITDWSSEEQFVVTSYNGERQQYVYRVETSLVETSGNIILNTQSEVELFASQANNVVNGNLTIGSTLSADDPIRSLASLSSIKNIAYNLVIGTGYAGETLAGLEQLETVGAINITSDSLLSVSLPSLTTLGTDLSIVASNTETVKLDVLTFIGSTLTLKGNSFSDISFENLETVGGTMTFNGSTSTSASSPLERIQFPSLKEVGGDMYLGYWSGVYVFEMPVVTSVGGTITFKTWSSIEEIDMPNLKTAYGVNFETVTSSLSASMNELTTITDDLKFYSAGIVSFSAPKLETVGDQLYFYSTSTKLTSLDFSSLSYIGDFEIYSTIMEDLSDFPALTTAGKVNIYSASSMKSLDGAPNFKTVEGQLKIYAAASFSTLDVRGMTMDELYLAGTTFTNLTTITGDDDFDATLTIYTLQSTATAAPELEGFKNIKALYVSSGTSYKSSLIFDGIETVAENVTFQSSTYATSISMPNLKEAGLVKFLYCNATTEVLLPSLEKITGCDAGDGFSYTVSSSVQTLDLSSLTYVEGGLSVSSIDAGATLSKIDAPNLETITGTFLLSGSNANFNDLSTLSSLTSVGGVSITTLTTLTDFSGLSGILPSFSGSWTVSGCAYNPTLQNMIDGLYSL